MYNCIYSLGSHCVTSSVLKKYELRKFSGFFDYLFIHKSDNFLDILEDGFSHILNLSNHTPIKHSHPLYERLKDVSIYSKYDSPQVVTFTHHNLLNKEVHHHYIRTKERFLKTVNFNTLFIYTSYHAYDKLNEEKREKIVQLLREKYNFHQFHLLFVEIEENNILKKQYTRISKNQAYSVYSINIHPDSYTGAIFKNDFDNENYVNIIYDNFELAHDLADKNVIDSSSLIKV
jgi:hypothetical protein